MKKLLVINGSPRSDEISRTYKALQAEIKFFKEKKPDLEVVYIKLKHNMQGCINCKECIEGCNVKDEFGYILRELKDSDAMLLGSPVYLDMPTAQTVAFLTRLTCMAENTNREFFSGKEAYLLSTAHCSGTKTCIHAMMGACEMLGFTIPARGTREYINLWKDGKIRGGMRREDAFYIE